MISRSRWDESRPDVEHDAEDGNLDDEIDGVLKTALDGRLDVGNGVDDINGCLMAARTVDVG